jgi:hypothetical protein
MATTFSLTSEMGAEVKKKLFGKSFLKKLLDKISFDLSYDLVDLYLESTDFPLKPSGTFTMLKDPIDLENDSLYIGEVDNETPSGLGYQISASGDYYEGHFLDGKFHGLGRLFTRKSWIIKGNWTSGKLKTGSIENFDHKKYEGELLNLEPSGLGTEESDEYIYVGSFLKGKKNGTGKIDWKDGTWYQGNFIMGRIEGKGKFHGLESDYEGDWKANKMHGLGIRTWPNGDKYEGAMVFGLQEGFGVFTSGDKKYAGQWKAGKQHGPGQLEEKEEIVKGNWNDGEFGSTLSSKNDENYIKKPVNIENFEIPEKIAEKYKKVLKVWKKIKKFKFEPENFFHVSEENWKNVGKGMFFGEMNQFGQPEGRGIWISISTIYEGRFVAGERNGAGRTVNVHQEVYEGSWISGKKSGFGVFKNSESVYVGEWEADKFNGKGKITTPRFKYDGDWVQGLQHGQGVMQHPDNTVYSGDFQKGVISGHGTLKYPSGKCVYGMWQNGRITKVLKKFNEVQQDLNQSLDQATRAMLRGLLE